MRAGSLYESKPGVAETTASMLTEGTQKRDYRQLSEETEGMGAALGAGAATDTATISASGLSESTDQIIALMADMLLNPSFPADRLDRHKFVQASQTAQRRTNPASLTADLSAKVFYGGTPYGRVSPTADQVAAITREDLAAFHEAYYRPNGALLGVSGDVDAKTLKGKLEAALSEWKARPQAAEPPKAEFKPKETTQIFLVDRP